MKERSQFRLFCERPDIDNDVDVDFQLFENGIIVATAVATREEEEITYTLEAGRSYSLTINYYLPWSGAPLCMTYSLELSIAPFVSQTTCDGQAEHLPPASLSAPHLSKVLLTKGLLRTNSLFFLHHTAPH